jgi:hypothetical protein
MNKAAHLLHRKARMQRGVSMIEFAIMAPFAFLFVLLIIQFGFVFIAKLNVNHATFMAARHAATQAESDDLLCTGLSGNKYAGTKARIKCSVQKGLIPFYQDSTDTNSSTRIGKAFAAARLETTFNPSVAGVGFLQVERLSPPASAFSTSSGFGLTDKDGRRYIPNDNLEWRSKDIRNNMTIQDANLLKIKVKYGYELKVPLMKTLIKNIMCAGGEGINAFGGDVKPWQAIDGSGGFGEDCRNFYRHGRIPLVSYATVHMQANVYE